MTIVSSSLKLDMWTSSVIPATYNVGCNTHIRAFEIIYSVSLPSQSLYIFLCVRNKVASRFLLIFPSPCANDLCRDNVGTE